MRARDLLLMARRRSGLTQAQLAQRSGVAQPQISRYESGTAEPTFAMVQQLVDACDLSLGLRLFAGDRSLHELALEQLKRPPADRVRGLLLDDPADEELTATLSVVGELADVVLAGDLAAVLHGSPRMLSSPTVTLMARFPERVVHDLEHRGWLDAGPDAQGRLLLQPGHAPIDVVERLPGIKDYRDLARDAVRLDGVSVAVAAVRDLLRAAEASRGAEHDLRSLDLRALLELDAGPVAA